MKTDADLHFIPSNVHPVPLRWSLPVLFANLAPIPIRDDTAPQ